MVEFGTGYWTPIDREYGHLEHGHSHDHAKATNDVGVNIGDFGMSMGLGPVPNVQSVNAKLRGGTKKLEFVFTGANKGSGQAQTPEMYGLKQRAAIVEMGKANKIDFTTHATVGVFGLAGMDQQGNFSKQAKNASLQEIRRAVEFAADVGRGGPVVVHTGEFHRPLVDAEWNKVDKKWQGKFKMYTDEPERFSYRVVDTRTGGVVNEARKNRKIARPEWLRAEKDNPAKGVKEGDYIDYFGNKTDMTHRVPIYDEKNQHFKVKQMSWEDFVGEAKEMTARAQHDFLHWDQLSPQEKEQNIFKVRIGEAKNRGLGVEHIKIRPEEASIMAVLETNAAHARGWAFAYGGQFDEEVKQMQKLIKAKEFYEKLEKATSDEEKWKLRRQIGESGLADLVPPEAKLPSEWIERSIRGLQNRMEQGREAASSQWSQAEEAIETIRYLESAETYAFKEACDAYAQAAMEAKMQSDKLAKQGALKKPLAIAMENLFPETYGAHPDELINLVKGSRQKMAELLQQRGMSNEAAQKTANDHITATFDTGHLNMWRKYWIGDPKRSMEQNDQEFNQWMLEKIGKMVDAGILGHVHLDDNYGYYDDHLAPGEGNTPIKEMVDLLKKKGYKGEMIIEPGADYTTDVTGFHSVMKTWRLFGSPVYGAAGGVAAPSGRGASWNQVGYGFFGQNQPPYFVFGGYSPSEDWTLWSGVPLE